MSDENTLHFGCGTDGNLVSVLSAMRHCLKKSRLLHLYFSSYFVLSETSVCLPYLQIGFVDFPSCPSLPRAAVYFSVLLLPVIDTIPYVECASLSANAQNPNPIRIFTASSETNL